MTQFIHSRLNAFVLAVVAACVFVGVADAGWVTIKNDTSKAIIVQETVIVKGRTVRGKPTKLLAGESFREFQNVPGIKTYEILDAANTTRPVWNGALNCKNNSQSFSVTIFQGKVAVIQVPEPKKK
ncbi:MAG: hypothetical protein L0241_22450 [Planctomycetia bacterium]|nr:hypothetical protein [Planctomycetia bacterium]